MMEGGTMKDEDAMTDENMEEGGTMKEDNKATLGYL